MGYDLELINKYTGKPCEYDKVTYRVDNENWLLDCRDPKCEFTVTYNYGKFFRAVFGDESLRILNGKTGNEALKILTDGIIKLGRSSPIKKELKEIEKKEIEIMREMDRRNNEPLRDITNCWMPTIANARHALIKLRHASLDFPNGVWKVE